MQEPDEPFATLEVHGLPNPPVGRGVFGQESLVPEEVGDDEKHITANVVARCYDDSAVRSSDTNSARSEWRSFERHARTCRGLQYAVRVR